MRKLIRSIATAVFLISPLYSFPAASAVLIDFASLPHGTLLPLPGIVPYATFSTEPGARIAVTGASSDLTTPNSILTTPEFSNTCGPSDAFCANGNIYVDFVEPVNNLSFVAGQVDDPPNVRSLAVSVFEDGVLTESIDVFGNGPPAIGGIYTALTVDLSGFANITRIEIFTFDGGGLVFDDFRFDPGRVETPVGVPEPGAFSLLALGLVALIGVGGKKRRDLDNSSACRAGRVER